MPKQFTPDTVLVEYFNKGWHVYYVSPKGDAEVIGVITDGPLQRLLAVRMATDLSGYKMAENIEFEGPRDVLEKLTKGLPDHILSAGVYKLTPVDKVCPMDDESVEGLAVADWR